MDNLLRMNQVVLSGGFGLGQEGRDLRAVRTALALYDRATARGALGRLWSALTRRPRHLLRLEDVRNTCSVRGSHYLGIRSVPIRQIRGSEDRSNDFDVSFSPLQEHSKGKWLSVAIARLRREPLSPVELIQVRDVYFVRDGHHRISVAKTLEQEHIDAEVIVWEVTGRLPWENLVPTRRLAAQPV
jgi:hypothetical protein